jgi:hypothetical protein
MNRNIQNHLVILSAIVAPLVFIAAAYPGVMGNFQEAAAQNVTTTANQTAGAASQNQTTSTMGNLTGADFGEVRDDLGYVREQLEDNNNVQAYYGFNFAENHLFGIGSSQGNQMGAITQQFGPLLDHIQKGKAALLEQDSPTALKELGSSEVELLKITQKLPASEEASESVSEEAE